MFKKHGKPAISLQGSALFAALFLLGTLPVFATLTGDIQGTVVDPSGLGVGGARVSIRNVGTRVARAFTTNDEGQFSALQLDVGDYEVRVEKDGFRMNMGQ